MCYNKHIKKRETTMIDLNITDPDYNFLTDGEHLTIQHKDKTVTITNWADPEDCSHDLTVDTKDCTFDLDDENDITIISEGVNIFVKHILDSIQESEELQKIIKDFE